MLLARKTMIFGKHVQQPFRSAVWVSLGISLTQHSSLPRIMPNTSREPNWLLMAG